jgi:UDP-glucose 4-epimerase
VGADQPYTVNELATVIAAAMGVPARVIHLDPRHEVVLAFSDHSKAERAFGVHPKVSLADGIQRMADWVRRHGARQGKVFENIEVTKKLPASWAVVARVE